MTPPSVPGHDRRLELPPVLLAVVVGLLGLLFYVFRLTAGPGWYDSGELAGVGFWLGIAHPTGYPLYSLLGRLSAVLFFPLSDPATRVNLFSAIAGGATLSVLTLASWRLISLLRLGPLPRPVRLAAAAAPALALGSIRLFAEQAVAAEVYTLHTLAAAVLLLLGLTCVLRGEQALLLPPGIRGGGRSGGVWAGTGWNVPLLTAYVAGLGLGNHVTLLLYLPAVAFLLWWAVRPNSAPELAATRIGFRDALRGLFPLALLALAGLSIYLLVPIRASLDPPFNWGGADSLRNFVRLVTAAEARGRQAQLDPVTVVSIWGRMASGMGWPVLGIALLGWIWAFLRRPPLGRLAGLYLLFPMLFLLLQLDILEDALLPVHLMVTMGIASAVVLVGERLVSLLGVRRGGPAALILVSLLLLLGPVLTAASVWREVTPTARGGPGVYVKAIVASVAGVPDPPEDVRGWVFTEDNTTAFLLWEQARVRDAYPSLHGIYLLLAREAWYRQELRRCAPSLSVPDLPGEVERQPHQVAGRALVEANKGMGVPLFLNPTVVPPPSVYGTLVPQGLLFRIEPEGYVPTGEDLSRHAAIIQRWSPAFAEDPPELDALGRDIWSYQHQLLGDAWALLGALEPAEIEYRAAVRVNPGRVHVWFALGRFYAAVRDWPKAAAAFEGALKRAPGDPELAFGLARALAMDGRFAEADNVLPERAPAPVSEADYLQVRARIRGGMGHPDQARADLEEAIVLNPDSGAIRNDLGVLLQAEGARESAREAFEKAVQLDPALAEAWSNLGSLALQDGRFTDAEEAIRRAIEAGANAPQLRQSLGALLLQRGELEEAEATLRENLSLWRTHADTYLTLGAVLEAQGRRREAISIYEMGRMAAPGDRRFARELRRIRAIPPA